MVLFESNFIFCVCGILPSQTKFVLTSVRTGHSRSWKLFFISSRKIGPSQCFKALPWETLQVACGVHIANCLKLGEGNLKDHLPSPGEKKKLTHQWEDRHDQGLLKSLIISIRELGMCMQKKASLISELVGGRGGAILILLLYNFTIIDKPYLRFVSNTLKPHHCGMNKITILWSVEIQEPWQPSVRLQSWLVALKAVAVNECVFMCLVWELDGRIGV